MIYAILMAGGMGTRLKVPEEKPLFKLLSQVLEWKFQNLGHFRQRLSKGLVLYIGLF